MIQRVFGVAFVLFACGVAALAQVSPYVGFEERSIKALSPEQVTGFLTGEGMGFAMAAELNEYPGPKHVLELAAELGLSPAQREDVQAIFDDMHAEAVRLGEAYVDQERRLDALFADGSAEPETLRAILTELGDMQSRLRFFHLNAHIATEQLLSDAQVARYVRLRGYGHSDDGGGHQHHQHKH